MNGVFEWLAPVRKVVPGGDVTLALCVLAQLSILILPVPVFLVDIALTFSFVSAILILLVALSIVRPLDFSSLPTLLLLTTILRLSLNVATARLILSHGSDGPYAAGQVIAAFGTFLMGGDLVVGVIVFTMLLVVNFVVITKGSSRIAEVSARFYLESMPGKQMAIDADLSSGIIDETTARLHRAELSEESGFYGAMDGASKFVRGDAVCALIVTLINILGGLAIGLLKEHIPLRIAVETFTSLTIGDGLASQLPALLVSTAAGIVVSKGATEGRMSHNLVLQLCSNRNVLTIVAFSAGGLALLPGLPAIPFFLVAVLAGVGSWLRSRNNQTRGSADVASPEPAEVAVALVPQPDILRVELGYGLLGLVSNGAESLPDRIKRLRRALASDLGIVLPAVRVQDNADLDAYIYRFLIKEIPAGNGELRPQMMLAIGSEDQAPDFPGEETAEPTFGLPARWIDSAVMSQARAANWTVVDPVTVLTTHLAEVVKENIGDFLSFNETQKLLFAMPPEQQKLVGDLVPSLISVGGLQRVLQGLLAERVSIRDMTTILEAVQEACLNNVKSVGLIVGHVRMRLSRQISEGLMGHHGYVPVIVLSTEWEDLLNRSLTGPLDDRQLSLGPDNLQRFLDRVRAVVDAANGLGERPALLTTTAIRYQLHLMVDRVRIDTPVIAQNELRRRIRMRVVGTI